MYHKRNQKLKQYSSLHGKTPVKSGKTTVFQLLRAFFHCFFMYLNPPISERFLILISVFCDSWYCFGYFFNCFL